MGFTKLWSVILHSSIWFQPNDVLKVWIYLLAMVGPDGIARTCAPDIGERCKVGLDRAREILAILEAPDPDSRSPEDDGRRIRRCDGGYFLINYHKYREMRDPDERKEYMRNYMEKYRADGKDKTRPVNLVNSGKPRLAQAEAEAEEKNKKHIGVYTPEFESFWSKYPARNGRKSHKKEAFQEWKKLNGQTEIKEKISKAIEIQAKYQKEANRLNIFVPEFPDACRWIKHRRWEDETPKPEDLWKQTIK